MIYELTRAIERGTEELRFKRFFCYTVVGMICRLDMMVYAGLSVLFLVFILSFRRALIFAAGSALLVLTILIFNHQYYGEWLPNTFYLKASHNLINEKIKFLINYSFESFSQLAPLLFAAAYGFWVLDWKERRRALPALSFAMLTIVYNLWLGGDWLLKYESRFLMPAYPPLFVLGMIGILRLAEKLAQGHIVFRRSLTVALFIALLASIIPSREATKEWLVGSTPTMYHDQNMANVKRGLFFKKASDPDTLIGLHWAGTPAYFAERPMLDFLGKCDYHIAHTRGHIYWPGHSKWDWDYVMKERQPDVISEASRGLEKRPDFQSGYSLVQYGEIDMYVRKGSESKIHVTPP